MAANPQQPLPAVSMRPAAKVLVATTAMLSFISFWRAAAVVLCDMGSSAFYAGAISEQAIGKSAPWFILAIMLFAYAVRSMYIESCSMFVRGGVYRVVKEAMGGTLAKFSVSALMFDYILTGPISGVSAGQYLTGFLNDLLRYAHVNAALPVNLTSALFAVLVTMFFWWENVKGVPESSEKALTIMYITTVMVAIMIVWCAVTILIRGVHLPPFPSLSTITYSDDSLGWLRHSRLPHTIALVGILIGLGHSVLAMSGEETLAQVYREVEQPKLPNLEKTGFIIFLYSLIFTAGVSFFAFMIIPDAVRPKYFDNLIGGLAMNFAGPYTLRLVFQGFVVLVGVLMLAGAVNTAIIGSNGVLNRVSEDGILPQWFRRPHRRFGTSYRMLNMIVLLQIATIVLSRGDIFVLGEAYAFGVMWSFAMKGLAVLVLRYKQPGKRDFRVPGNFRIGNVEIPVGLGFITVVLFALCITNLFTKQVATISGIIFTVAFFAVFEIAEKVTHRGGKVVHAELDQFNLEMGSELTPESVGVEPGNILVPVSTYFDLHHVEATLRRAKGRETEIVVLHVRLLRRATAGEYDLDPDQLFSANEQMLFTKVLALAEKQGRPVKLTVAVANDLWDGILRTAANLQSATIVAGASAGRPLAEQALTIGAAWERLSEPRPHVTLEILTGSGKEQIFYLGPHAPRLTQKEIDLLHQVWLKFTELVPDHETHHHDVVHFALDQLERGLEQGRAGELRDRFREHLEQIQNRRTEVS